MWTCLLYSDIDASQYGTCVNAKAACVPCLGLHAASRLETASSITIGAPLDGLKPPTAFHASLLKVVELEARAPYACGNAGKAEIMTTSSTRLASF